MIINDKVYGKLKITEPISIELIKSKPIQRLKKIDQHGTQAITRPSFKKVSRFEHSVGVMLLLKKFKVGLEEQIAGLFHDISHTAFSHVVDWAIGDSTDDNFHEKYIKKIVYQSEIPKIFKKYKLNLKKFFIQNENLLERPEPDLCADRIDYFLRDNLICYKFINKKQIVKILKDLKVINNEWVFINQKTAKFFAQKFLHTSIHGWYHPQNQSGFKILGSIIKKAIKQKYIKENDLFTDDKTLLKKLLSIKNQQIKDNLKLLKNFKAEINPKNYDFIARMRFRAVDPYVFKNGKLIRLSKLDKNFKKYFLKRKRYIKKGIPIKIINKSNPFSILPLAKGRK